jgi:hypothetical protein
VAHDDELPHRERWARLRFAIIGPLLAAPPPPGELRAALRALAAKTWRHPRTGLELRFGVSTLERWFYAARRAADPVQALRNQPRRDVGRFPSLSAAASTSRRCWSASSTTGRGSCAMPSGTPTRAPRSWSTACARRCRRWGCRAR